MANFNPMQMMNMMSQMKNGGGNGGMNPMAMMSQMMGGNNNGGGMNPMQMMSGMNPQQMMNNPQFARAQEMLNGKSPQEQEQVVRNMCQQMGIDFEQAKGMARSMGIKI